MEVLTEEAEAIGDMADDEEDLAPESATRLSEVNARLDQLTDCQSARKRDPLSASKKDLSADADWARRMGVV